MTAQVSVATPISPTDVYDHLTQAREILEWVEALGYSIKLANENGAPHYANRLASLVHYLGTDWSSHFDSQAGKVLKEHQA